MQSHRYHLPPMRVCPGGRILNVRHATVPRRGPRLFAQQTAMDTRSWCSGAGTLAAGADETQFALDALPDGCLTNVLEHLDIQSLLAMRGVSRRSQQLASQPALWRCVLQYLCAEHDHGVAGMLAGAAWLSG
jgi:hypothetical protein